MATMRDVARRASVSIATVSAVINGTANVSSELRGRVQAAIAEVGYAPDSVARSLRTGTSRTLGLLIPDVTNPLFAALARAVENAASDAGYAVFLCNTEERTERQTHYLRLLRAHKAAAVILAPTAGTAADPAELRAIVSAPIVVVDRTVPGLETDTVVVDNQPAARRAVAHLIDLGHRRVAAILGLARNSTARERLAGYRQALADHGLAEDPDLARVDCRDGESAFAAATAMLRSAAPPTAIFAGNDKTGLGALRAIATQGLRCPDDVSFCCFDGSIWAEAVHPAVTTIQQPVERLGTLAVGMALERIGGLAGPARRVELPTEFLVRQSCAAPRGR